MPCFNRQEMILETLKRVHSLDYRPLELVIVDDGSTDHTFSKISEFSNVYAAGDFKIIKIKQTNKGAPAARNAALAKSSGDFIQFLDSDDFLKHDKISKQIKCLISTSAEIAICDYERLYPDNTIVYYSNKNPCRKILRGGSVTISTPLIKAAIIDQVKWDESLRRNQDVDYILKLVFLTTRVIHIPESLFVYVQHSQARIRDSYFKNRSTIRKRIKNVVSFYFSNKSVQKTKMLFPLLGVIWFMATKQVKKTIASILISTRDVVLTRVSNKR